MDSVPFMVTLISRETAKVLYQNGPSKYYHGEHVITTDKEERTGGDLLSNLFSLSESDGEAVLQVRGNRL